MGSGYGYESGPDIPWLVKKSIIVYISMVNVDIIGRIFVFLCQAI